MDGNTVGFFLIMLAIIAGAFYAGLNLGERVGKSDTIGRINHKPILVPPFPFVSKKMPPKELHERDPWDEMRLDQTDNPKVVQTVEKEYE